MLRQIRVLPLRTTRAIPPRLAAPLTTQAEPSPPTTASTSPAPPPAAVHITRTIPIRTPSAPPGPSPTTPPQREPYTITRTPSRQLPIYQLAKAGGNLKLTRIRKVGGDAAALKEQLEGFLEPRPKEVGVNPLTGHVVVKGWYKKQVENFLVARGF